jgi:DNA-binding transcriptional LysR family regulator
MFPKKRNNPHIRFQNGNVAFGVVMEFSDLRAFVAIAELQSVRAAAEFLHQSPSALSKALKRLEAHLQSALFDRMGTGLRLNANGERLRTHAQALLARVELTEREFKGEQHALKCRIAGPSVLQWRFAGVLGRALHARYRNSVLSLQTHYEDAALASLLRGEVDFALVSGLAITNSMDAKLASLPLGEISMQLAIASTHALAQANAKPSKTSSKKGATKNVRIKWAKVLEHAFACPTRSLFCGLERGARADGWRDDQLPRKIQFWSDDFQVLLGLVQTGAALAYLPDFVVQSQDLLRVTVSDCPYRCLESAHLVWRNDSLLSWQNTLLDALTK